jgi:septum site-determining protein MinD
MASVRDADRIIGLIEAAGKPEPLLLINRLRPEMIRRGDMMDVADVLEVLHVGLIGLVPEDESVIVATNRGQPVVLEPKSHAGRALTNAARRILGEEVPLEELESQPGLLDRLLRAIGTNFNGKRG